VEIGSSGILRSSGVKFLNRTSATDFKKPCSPFSSARANHFACMELDSNDSNNLKNSQDDYKFLMFMIDSSTVLCITDKLRNVPILESF
jgi:hypothetical protein